MGAFFESILGSYNAIPFSDLTRRITERRIRVQERREKRESLAPLY